LTKNTKWVIVAIVFFAAVAGCDLQAGDTKPKLMHTSTDAKAGRILDKAYQYLESLNMLSFRAKLVNEDLYEGKMVVELTHWVDVEIERPGHLRIDIVGDTRHRSYYLNEGILTIFDPDLNLYGELRVPGGIDEALDDAFDHYRIKTPLANLLYSDISRRLKAKTEGHYFGVAYVGETLCDYIGFSDQRRSFQLWVAKGEKPFIRKYVIIDKSTPVRLHSTVVIDWDNKGGLSEKIFQFFPPKGTRKIEVLAREGVEQ